jgi:hypothetical protein
MTPEELRKRVFEVETARNVNRADHPSLMALSPKKYLFALLWTDPDTIIIHKTQWAEDNGFYRTEVYQYLGDRNVQQAIEYLDASINRVEAVQVAKVVKNQALKGCTKSQKLYLERWGSKNSVNEPTQQDDTLQWDTSLATNSARPNDNPTPEANRPSA